LYVQLVAACCGQESSGIWASKQCGPAEGFRAGPRGPATTCHLSAGLRQRVGRVPGDWRQCSWNRARFAPGWPGSLGVEPAASLPGPSARAALPGVARQAGQYR